MGDDERVLGGGVLVVVTVREPDGERLGVPLSEGEFVGERELDGAPRVPDTDGVCVFVGD